jgi:Family of unknown function (DUF6353)
VLACRATLKVHEILHEAEHDLTMAKSMDHEEYSEKDRSRDVAIIYARSAGKFLRIYGPSILLGAASIGALTQSHNILQQRNLALTAAYAAIEQAFNEYRGRVIDKYGEDQDREFRYSAEEVEVIDEDGKMTREIRVGSDAPSMYARFFDETSTQWKKYPEYNKIFLLCQQNYVNDMLKSRGHIFLNEVYDALGMERSRAGQVVGWIISHDGDNYIDFGVFDDTETARNFVNGRENSILIDFNVDGVIYDKIGNDRKQESIEPWQSLPTQQRLQRPTQ